MKKSLANRCGCTHTHTHTVHLLDLFYKRGGSNTFASTSFCKVGDEA